LPNPIWANGVNCFSNVLGWAFVHGKLDIPSIAGKTSTSVHGGHYLTNQSRVGTTEREEVWPKAVEEFLNH
jgi:hypothetical protein